jgi:hypothetical protein
MRHESSQAEVMDFAEIWHGAQHRRTEEITSDINNLKTVSLFSAVGQLASVELASYGWDWIPAFSRHITARRTALRKQSRT